MKIKCINCGAIFESNKANCPYCGYINIQGAEQEYLENLDEIIDNFEDVSNHPKEEVKKEAISTTLRILKIFTIALVSISILSLVWFLIYSFINRPYKSADEQKQQLLWEKETYPKLDEWYEQGDYEAIYKFMEDVYCDKNNDYSFATWEHSEFFSYYSDYMYFQSIKESKEYGEPYSDFQISSILINVLDIESPDFFEYFTTDEIKLAKEYAKEQYNFLISEFLYTEEELKKLYKRAMKNDYLDIGKLYEEGEIREAKLYD